MGRTGSGPCRQTPGSLKAKNYEKEWLPRPAPAWLGRRGRKPAGTPSPSREGPGNRGGAPAGRQGPRLRTSPDCQEGCGTGQGHSPNPPRFRKIRPARRESGLKEQGSLQLEGGLRMTKGADTKFPGSHALWYPNVLSLPH